MNYKNILTAGVVLGALGVGFLSCMLHTDNEWSLSERRPLAQKPVVTVQTLSSGKAMKDFEGYSLDQFPMRELFRNLKAQIQYHLLLQKDNNGIYMVNGSLSKLETKLSENSVKQAARKLNAVRDQYFPDSRVFYGMIPDKNYYMAEANGYPHLDYDRLQAILTEDLVNMEKIELADCLTVDDYYLTDSHWRQEQLEAVANRIAERLGVTVTPFDQYEEKTFANFRGVYWGQSALNLPAEPLHYLTNEMLENCTVHHFETGKDTGIYQPEKLDNKDPYDVFLGGADALLTIKNPAAHTGRELVIFRDSFGSSLTPLLLQDYETVTLVDLRYLSSQLLGQFVDFHGQDVLFLYSPAVYNNSTMLK